MLSPMSRIHFALAFLAVSACQCGAEDTITRVEPKIGLVEPAIDFGEVPIGAVKRVRFAVKNDGAADLSISAIDTANPFSATLIDTLLPPGASGIIDVAFKPVNNERANGMLLIRSNDATTPALTVSLTGLGVAGGITIRPSSITLRDTTVGTLRSAEVFIQNIGVDGVEGKLTTDSFQRPENFSLSNLSRFDGAASLVIAGRSDIALDLRYRPLMPGEDRGRIVFEICGERCGVEVEVDASAVDSTVKIEPPLVDFGTVGIATTKSDSVLVKNIGTRVLEVLSISVSGGNELVASSARPFPASIEPGGSLAIGLDFTPVTAAPFSAELSVRTTDAAVPEARVQVRGQGEGPLFIVQPDVLAFGVMRDMATHRRAFVMFNAGSADVQVRAIRVSGDPAFAVGETPGLPARLRSGESLTAYVNFTPPALGEYTGTLEVESDDPANGVVSVLLSGGLADRLCELGLSEPRLNFGLMPVGYTRNRSLTLTNIGTDTCNLLSGAFRAPIDPTLTLIGGGFFPITLLPGDQTSIQFNYTPVEQTESKGNYVINTDDPVYPERHLVLLGSAQGYVDIFVEPDHIDFGQTRISCQAPSRTVTVYNAGTVSSQVNAVNLNAVSSELGQQRPALPARLAAGSQVYTSVNYRPADIGVDRGELEIVVDGLPYPLIVPVSGEGSNNPSTIDTFVQDDSSKVDVLFVIDDSCSMSDEQTELSQNFQTFVREANMRNVDFQIGITTTTLFPTAGLLVGEVLTANTPRLESEFSSQASVGIDGSGVEQGLDAVSQALSLAIAGVMPNSDLLRTDATLFAAVISDEDDQSNGTGVLYLNALRTAAPAGFVFAAVTGQAGGCGNFMQNNMTGVGAAPAPIYEDFVRLTGGISASICADWSTTLGVLGNAAFGLRKRFQLARGADTNVPIEVRIDGMVVPPSEWTYDAADQSVRFNDAPAEGSMIEIEYTPTC